MTLTLPPPQTIEIWVTLDVGGKHFKTSTSTLKTLPRTRLGKLALEVEKNQGKCAEFFFDRNPKIVNCLLNLYRTGRLHIPGYLCVAAALEELRFWEIPLELIQDCCWKRFENYQSDERVLEEIENFLREADNEYEPQEPLTWRMKIWLIIERPDYSVAAKIWNLVYIIFIFLSILSFAFETVQNFRRVSTELQDIVITNSINSSWEEIREGMLLVHVIAVTVPDVWLLHLRYCTFGFFLADFVLRLLLCPTKKRFFKQARNWLEIFIVTQSSIYFAVESSVLPAKIRRNVITDTEKHLFVFFFALCSARALRIFYIARNVDSMKILLLCAKSSSKEILLLITSVLSFVTLFGTIAYLAESLDERNTFASVPAAMWWAIITMTTVGYGDVYPVSAGGQFVGAVCALAGVIVMALPIAVIASKFSVYHDNISCRQQKRIRMSFLKENTAFNLHTEDEGPNQSHGHDCDGADDPYTDKAVKVKAQPQIWRGSKNRVDVTRVSSAGTETNRPRQNE